MPNLEPLLEAFDILESVELLFFSTGTIKVRLRPSLETFEGFSSRGVGGLCVSPGLNAPMSGRALRPCLLILLKESTVSWRVKPLSKRLLDVLRTSGVNLSILVGFDMSKLTL
jgi:hypothetical protein